MSLILLSLFATSCHHQIAFQDIGYPIEEKQQNAVIVVVVDPATLNKVVPVRLIMTGMVHSCDARPGEMLKQISDVEFPPMFKSYEMSHVYKEP